jgi:predicted permease
MITESVLLAAIGGVAGVLMATWLTPILQTFSPIRVGALGAFLTDFRIDARVLVFALVASAATGVLFGSAPALRATRRDVASSLKRRDQHGGSDQAGRRWLGAFVVAELALSTALLVAGGLVVRSFERLQRVDLGIDPNHALTMRMALAPTKFPDATSRRAFVERTLDRVRALPGVRAAGSTTNLPLDDLSYDAVFSVEGRPPANPADVPITAHRLVSPGYLQALGVRLVKGRLIDEHDRADTLPVVVVTEEFSRQAFQADDPIGRRVRRIGGQGDSPWLAVIGVVADVKEDQFNFRINRPAWYLPYLQADSATPIDLLVRTDRDPSTFTHAVREAIRSVDPTQAIGDVMPLQDQVSRVSVTDRFSALLGGALAGTGLFLAICGLYGVIAYSVSQRTGEFGLRIALGARPVDLMRLVVGQGVLLIIAGIVVGLFGARVMTMMLSATLYEVGPGDPATFTLAAVGLAVVALVACYVPARRAVSIDPIAAMRID